MTEEKYNSKKYNSKKYIKPEVKLDENHFEIDEALVQQQFLHLHQQLHQLRLLELQ